MHLFVITGKFQTRISGSCHDDVGICRLQRGMFSYIGRKFSIKVAKKGMFSYVGQKFSIKVAYRGVYFLMLVKSLVLKRP